VHSSGKALALSSALWLDHTGAGSTRPYEALITELDVDGDARNDMSRGYGSGDRVTRALVSGMSAVEVAHVVLGYQNQSLTTKDDRQRTARQKYIDDPHGAMDVTSSRYGDVVPDPPSLADTLLSAMQAADSSHTRRPGTLRPHSAPAYRRLGSVVV